MDRSARIHATFNDLNKESLSILDDFYAQDVVFEDPVGRIEGLDALRKYYGAMYEHVQTIRFEFSNEVVQNDTHVVFWTMYFRSSKLKKGHELTVTGNSVLTFGNDDKVTRHRDYFDLGELVYEHLPLLGMAVRSIKRRLSHQE